MKRFYYVIIFSILMLVTSCSNNDKSVESHMLLEDAYLAYNINNEVFDFSVDEEGNLYYISYEKVSDTSIDDGNQGDQSTWYNQQKLSIHNTTGELIHKFEFYESYLTHDGNKIYGISFNGIYSGINLVEIKINQMEPGDGNPSDSPPYEAELVTEIREMSRIRKLEVDNNLVYILGKHKDYTSEAIHGLTSDGYNYEGEKIQCFDINTGEWSLLDIQYPVTMSKTLDEKILIYAYDRELGFYFILYDRKTDSYTEPYYNDIGYAKNIEVYNQDYDIVYVNQFRNPAMLSTVNPLNLSGVAEIVPVGGYRYNNPYSMGEYTYYINESGDDIIRIRNQAYLRGNKNIVALAPNFSGRDTPFGLGYNFQTIQKSREEMALEILSQSDAYDLYQLNSRDDISANIKKYGAFYPLNDVPGVKEYLDLCFPYIKETAINQNGDIWMLPIFVEIPVYTYNAQFCKDMGVDISSDMSFHEFRDMLLEVRKSAETASKYSNSKNGSFVNNIFYQYLRQYSNFDQPLFRELALGIAEGFNYEKKISDGNSMLKGEYDREKNRDFLFLMYQNIDVLVKFSYDEVLNAMKIPSIGDDNKSIASCYFLAVNPEAKNLKETLNYISSLSKYLADPLNNNYVMLKERESYPDTKYMDDLYDIYSNGEICFTYDSEIYLEDFEKYLRGEIDLDTFIQEANRKLKIYLEE